MPNPLNLDRQILASFLPNHQAVLAFERMQNAANVETPSTVEEAASLAALATAIAQQALGMIADAMAEIERLQSAPRAELGSISPQNADAVEITGGRIGIDAGTVAAPSLYMAGEDTTGLYRVGANSWGLSIAGVNLVTWSGAAAAFAQNISTTKQLISTLAIGTAPIVVNSTTLVPNLYVARAALADLATTATTATSATTAGSATTANTLTSPTTFPAVATDLPTVITLANALRAAAIAKGL